MSHKKAVLITCCVAFLWSLAGWNIKFSGHRLRLQAEEA